MKRIGALLGAELLSWPEVTTNPMFGLAAYYRAGVVFALLPVKRGFETADGLAYKLASGGESREGEKWSTLEVASEAGIGNALGVLEKAYQGAGKSA